MMALIPPVQRMANCRSDYSLGGVDQFPYRSYILPPYVCTMGAESEGPHLPRSIDDSVLIQ